MKYNNNRIFVKSRKTNDITCFIIFLICFYIKKLEFYYILYILIVEILFILFFHLEKLPKKDFLLSTIFEKTSKRLNIPKFIQLYNFKNYSLRI